MTSSQVVFWDFDGVIKDSVEIKSVAFEKLFAPYGKEVASRVRQHHESNGGLSRYEKMPIYLGWVGEFATEERIRVFCNQFAQIVCQGVIDAPWVKGVREYIETHHSIQRFMLVTATPQVEILRILHALELAHCFREVHGAPTPKSAAIRDVLRRWQCSPEQALVVGDSQADLDAARGNRVPFLLRRTKLNKFLQERFAGPKFCDLNDE